MPAHLDRMIYIDDSGRPQSGHAVYGWISLPPERWAEILRGWLEFRAYLCREFGVLSNEELHSTQYIQGRGRITDQPPESYQRNGVTLWKDLGRDIAVEALKTVSSLGGLEVGAVYSIGKPEDVAQIKEQLYSHLVASFQEELEARDALALLFIDGNGSDTSYRRVHRELDISSRRIIEDPIHQDSKTSQLMQIADLVAWTAHVAGDRHSSNAFAHEWYEEYLSCRDRHRSPQEIPLENS